MSLRYVINVRKESVFNDIYVYVMLGYMSLKHALMTYRGGFNDILYVMVICHGEICIYR